MLWQHGSKFSVGRLDEWDRRSHDDSLRDFAGPQNPIDSELIVHLQNNPRSFKSVEPVGIGADLIIAGEKVGGVVFP